MKRPEILPLTSLRFLAAFWVVAYHYLTPALRGSAAPRWVVDLCAAGYVGVPVFFVLSGFVLAYTYEGTDFRRRGERRAFWAARFARVYPLYIVAFLLAVPPALVALWQGHPGIATPREHLVGLVLSPLLLQSWGGEAYRAWNTPGWTLSVEAAFYVAFPFVALHLARNLGRWVAVSAALSAALLAWHVAGGPFAPDTAFATRNPIVHVPAFLAGMWLARHRHEAAAFTARQADLLAAGAAAGFLAVVLLMTGPGAPPPEAANPFLNSILLVPLVAPLVLALATQRGRIAAALSPRLLVRLGTISYGVYILQDPVAKYVLYAPEVVLGLGLAGTFAGFALLAAVLLAASEVAYRVIERPWQRRLRAWLTPKKPEAPVAKPEGAAEPVAA